MSIDKYIKLDFKYFRTDHGTCPCGLIFSHNLKFSNFGIYQIEIFLKIVLISPKLGVEMSVIFSNILI